MNSRNLLALGVVAIVFFMAGIKLSGPAKQAFRALTPAAPAKTWADGEVPNIVYGSDTVAEGRNFETSFRSGDEEVPLTLLPGVFTPREAKKLVLPVLERYPELYKGKSVLEIGGGSGINSLYMALNGATKVVATDISEQAIATIKLNAEKLGVADIVEARLVPLDDMSAYSVVGATESFGFVLSNPPYTLDLDSSANTPANDTGDLGISIIRGFDAHLDADGISLLFYPSLFYHEVMAEIGRYEGYDIRNHRPPGMIPREAETLFNSYLLRILERENLPEDTFSFVKRTGPLQLQYLRNGAFNPDSIAYEQLILGSEHSTYHSGWIAISHK